MPPRHQDTKNHKVFILKKLRFVKLSVLSVFVVKNDFSEWGLVLLSDIIAIEIVKISDVFQGVDIFRRKTYCIQSFSACKINLQMKKNS